MAQALDDLLDALEDVDDATREEASKALAELADATTLDALVSACEDEYWAVRANAGRAVARIGGVKAVEALIVLFNDSIMEVRNDAVAAMALMGAAVVNRLIAALKDERWRVREYAAKTCGEIKDQKAVERRQRRWARSAIRGRSRP
jgi:HEAT repeat protein